MRLFTALWLPAHARDHLSAEFDAVRASPDGEWRTAVDGVRSLRFIPQQRWHLTLCFHGDDADPDRLGARLDRRVRRLAEQNPDFGPPRLRLAGAGSFRTVLWIGLEPAGDADASVLRMLAGAAGSDPASFRAHVTVARWRAGTARVDRSTRAALADPFADYAGPWWEADELALVRSEQRSGAVNYRTVHRVRLTALR